MSKMKYFHVDRLLKFACPGLQTRRAGVNDLMDDALLRIHDIEVESIKSVGVAGYDPDGSLVPYSVSDPVGMQATHMIRKEWYKEYVGLNRFVVSLKAELKEYGLIERCAAGIVKRVALEHVDFSKQVIAHYYRGVSIRSMLSMPEYAVGYSTERGLYGRFEKVLLPYEEDTMKHIRRDSIPYLWCVYAGKNQ